MSSPDKPKHSPASPESRNGSLSCFSVPRACLFTPIRLHSPQSGRGISIKNTRGTVLMVGRDYGCGRSAELTRHFVPRGPWLAVPMFCFWSETLDKKYTAAAGECWRFFCLFYFEDWVKIQGNRNRARIQRERLELWAWETEVGVRTRRSSVQPCSKSQMSS